jgi:hypothetical protein
MCQGTDIIGFLRYVAKSATMLMISFGEQALRARQGDLAARGVRLLVITADAIKSC